MYAFQYEQQCSDGLHTLYHQQLVCMCLRSPLAHTNWYLHTGYICWPEICSKMLDFSCVWSERYCVSGTLGHFIKIMRMLSVFFTGNSQVLV